MDTNPPFIEFETYEAMIRVALHGAGLSPFEAAAVASQRWPMEFDGIVDMLRFRGLELSEGDLTAFLLQKYGLTHHPDGEPLTARSVTWPERNAEGVFQWALETGVGTRVVPLSPGKNPPPELTVAGMLDSLRSSDIATRVIGGTFLAKRLGAVCKVAGETDEDFQYILAPQISDLLTRAMTGEAAAVDLLERELTSEHPAPNAAARHRSALN